MSSFLISDLCCHFVLRFFHRLNNIIIKSMGFLQHLRGIYRYTIFIYLVTGRLLDMFIHGRIHLMNATTCNNWCIFYINVAFLKSAEVLVFWKF